MKFIPVSIVVDLDGETYGQLEALCNQKYLDSLKINRPENYSPEQMAAMIIEHYLTFMEPNTKEEAEFLTGTVDRMSESVAVFKPDSNDIAVK